jgi:hypothetical protein
MGIMALQALSLGGRRMRDNPGGVTLALMAIKTENGTRLDQQGRFA